VLITAEPGPGPAEDWFAVPGAPPDYPVHAATVP
jgi:hypothetical protein